MKKYYYCSECEKYPDAVVFFPGLNKEYRKWTGEIYSLTGSDTDTAKVHCGDCGHELANRRKQHK